VPVVAGDTKSVAVLVNTTERPSALMESELLIPVAVVAEPPVPDSSWVVLLVRSRRKTWALALD
jgi:hypothetical protein